jgi:hypothetical protein
VVMKYGENIQYTGDNFQLIAQNLASIWDCTAGRKSWLGVESSCTVQVRTKSGDAGCEVRDARGEM